MELAHEAMALDPHSTYLAEAFIPFATALAATGHNPLPPEGASAILHRTTDRAPELAAQQRVRSLDLLADGIIDRIVAEHPDAADEPEDFCRRMAQVIAGDLSRLTATNPTSRLAARHDRYRRLGL